MPETLAISTAAAMTMLGVSRRTLGRLIAAGKIIARRVSPNSILIDYQSILDYWASLPRVGTAANENAVLPVKRYRPRSAA
jgi:hypothetical protein